MLIIFVESFMEPLLGPAWRSGPSTYCIQSKAVSLPYDFGNFSWNQTQKQEKKEIDLKQSSPPSCCLEFTDYVWPIYLECVHFVLNGNMEKPYL